MKKMKKMKKTFLILGILLSFSVLATAQKTAYVHRDSVLRMMPEMKQAQQEINSFLQQAQQQISEMQTEYNQKVQEFNNSKDTLSDFIKQSKLQDINDLQKKIQQFQANAQTEYMNKQKTLILPIQKKFDEALEKVRKKGGYDVVINIDPNIILYVNEKYVITGKVIKELGIGQ